MKETIKFTEEEITSELNYLLSEGFITLRDGLYRMKTPEEQLQEIEELYE